MFGCPWTLRLCYLYGIVVLVDSDEVKHRCTVFVETQLARTCGGHREETVHCSAILQEGFSFVCFHLMMVTLLAAPQKPHPSFVPGDVATTVLSQESSYPLSRVYSGY